MEREDIQIKFVDIDLCEYNNGQIPGVPENPRTREDKKQRNLQKSIEELPEMTIARAALCFMHDGHYVVIGGNRRLEAQRALQRKEVPIIELPKDTPVEKLRRIALLDNESTGETDWAKVAKEWNVEEIKAWNISAPKGWYNEQQRKEVQEDEFEEDTDQIEHRVTLGDIWQLGNHRLMCGDSCDIEQVKKLCGGQQVDCWLTDPPYNVALGYEDSASEARQRHRRTDQKVVLNDSMPDSEFRQFLVKAYTAAKESMKAGAAYYIFHADTESYNFRGALRDVGGMQLRETLIWVKDAITLGRQDYQWKHEPCLYGWKEGAAHKFFNDRKQTTCIEFPRPKRSEEHPTMKPVPLFAYLMENSTEQGDLVLDSFGGSGTTLIAAEQLNRKACLMELSPVYCDVIIARWEKLTGGASP